MGINISAECWGFGPVPEWDKSLRPSLTLRLASNIPIDRLNIWDLLDSTESTLSLVAGIPAELPARCRRPPPLRPHDVGIPSLPHRIG